MKKNTLVALGLVSMISLGMAAGTVKAADGDKKSVTTTTNGKVGFATDWTIQPPTTGPEIKNPNPESEKGDSNLSIIYATNFNFGYQDGNNPNDDSYTLNQFTKGTELTLNAFSQTYTKKEKDAEGKDVTFEGPLGISIGNSSMYRNWRLTAKAGAFTSSAGSLVSSSKEGVTPVVKGVSMILNGTTANKVTGTLNENTMKPIAPKIVIETNEEEVTVAERTGDKDETAITNLAFGDYTDENKKDRYTGVQLFVPGEAEVVNGVTYTSEITWTLSADPFTPGTETPEP